MAYQPHHNEFDAFVKHFGRYTFHPTLRSETLKNLGLTSYDVTSRNSGSQRESNHVLVITLEFEKASIYIHVKLDDYTEVVTMEACNGNNTFLILTHEYRVQNFSTKDFVEFILEAMWYLKSVGWRTGMKKGIESNCSSILDEAEIEIAEQRETPE
ncbi:hypothetical protein [Flaviaesturariibacter amylovorans]|uniref:Uncharacterized protein n=1 Tax=Flaviaesturariibacter amylovorans TaxID=1084520 RepID=A0ABP8GLH2_9BACT